MEQHDEVLVALRRIIRAIDLRSKKLLQTSGLTGPQLLVLQAIGQGGELASGDLARQVSLSQATITSILDRLERRHLVQRTRDTRDKRKVLARLTEEGQQALKNAPTLLQEDFINRFQRLESWEQTLLLSSLQRIAQMMDAQDLDASPLLTTGNVTPPE